MSLADFGNTYFQSKEPWKLIKTDRNKCAEVLKDSLQIAKALIILFEPDMPGLMETAWKQLGFTGNIHTVSYKEALIELESGKKLPKPEIIISKIENSKIEEMEALLTERIGGTVEKEIKAHNVSRNNS
jgi:methionyl-tRNA synthetase